MRQSPNFKQYYSTFRDIIKVVYSSTSLEEVLELVVWKASETLNAKGAVLRLLNVESNELEIGAAYGLGEKYLEKGAVSRQQTITDLCRQNKVIFIKDFRLDPRVQYPDLAWNEGIRFIMDFPLSVANDVIGIMRMYFSETRRFTEDELNFIIAVVEQCSCAIGKARLIEAHEIKYHQLALQTEKLSALGRMAAGIAHEINNPLAGILLYSSNMIKKVSDGGPIREGLDIVIHETIRCRKIIQELLDFSKEREPQKTLEDINGIIEKALAILENEFRLNRVNVHKDLAGDIQKTMLDSNQIQQVFVNLLINAVEAVSQYGTIRIKSVSDVERRCLVVEVADEGPGIHVQELDKIFEPFYSTKPKGTGLGLSVSYGIIHSHHGEITVESRPGEGTRFVIKLPLIAEDV